MRRRRDVKDLIRWSRRDGSAATSPLHEDVRLRAVARLAAGSAPRLNAERASRILTRLERSIICPRFAIALAGGMGRDLRRLQRSVMALEAALDLSAVPEARDLALLADACMESAAATRAHRMVADLLDLPRVLEVAAAGVLGRTQAWALARSARALSSPSPEGGMARLLLPRYRRLVAHDAGNFHPGSTSPLSLERPIARPRRPDDHTPESRREQRSGGRSASADAQADAAVDWLMQQLSWCAARAALKTAVPATRPMLRTEVHAMEERRRIRRLGRTRALLDLIQACGSHLPVAASWERRAVRALQRAAQGAGMAPWNTSYADLRKRLARQRG